MNITQAFRVELDPNEVPTPARAPAAKGESFDHALDEARLEARDQREAAEASSAEVPIPDEPPAEAAGEEAPEQGTGSRGTTTTQATPAGDTGAITPSAEVPAETTAAVAPTLFEKSTNPSSPRPVPRETSALPAPETSKDLGPTATPTETADHSGQPPLPGQATTSPAPASPSSATASPGDLAGSASTTTQVARGRLRGPGTTGYLTHSKQMLQLAEDARQSLFRQIALRLTPEGGEIRFLLDPPELGRMDLHMAMEHGVMRLSILTERPELAQMLDQNMSQLRQVLEAQGTSVAETHVQAGSEGSHFGEAQGDAPWFAGGGKDELEDDHFEPLRRAGFIKTEGLDFLV